jgi:succinylglutamate desuccinylase
VIIVVEQPTFQFGCADTGYLEFGNNKGTRNNNRHAAGKRARTMSNNIAASARSLAEADFTDLADRFANAGFAVRLPARGMLQLTAPGRFLRRPKLLLSVGVHGDETAPIEILAQLLDELGRTPGALSVDLMVVVGNLAAIAAGKRFIDIDLNRLFKADRSGLINAADTSEKTEITRADAIMRAVGAFFAGQDAEKWHFDLHTAIRPSRYPAFAVVPDVIGDTRKEAMLHWLGRADIGAVILNRSAAGTFSAWTAERCGAVSATVELGRVGALGANDLRQFEGARSALNQFLRTGRPPSDGSLPEVFRVCQELIKHTEQFRMTFGPATENFSALEPGALIAEDGDTIYRVGEQTEYVVFPNPDVRPGLRAGLMVVKAVI